MGAKPDDYMRPPEGCQTLMRVILCPLPRGSRAIHMERPLEWANTRSNPLFQLVTATEACSGKLPSNLWILWKTQDACLLSLWITGSASLRLGDARC